MIGVSPAMRPPDRCTAEHNRQLREDHRGRKDARCKPGRLGTARSSPSPSSALTPLDSTSLPPELRSADVRPRSTPVAWISPDRRVARVFRERSIMCSSQCTERALSRGDEFPSEPVVHNRTLNIEAGVATLFTSDVLIANSETQLVVRRGFPCETPQRRSSKCDQTSGTCGGGSLVRRPPTSASVSTPDCRSYRWATATRTCYPRASRD